MASILICSERGKLLPIGSRLKSEGHIVKVWMNGAPTATLKGSRNPSRVQKIQMLEQYDLILSEPQIAPLDSERLVLGNNKVMHKLSTDTAYADKVKTFIGYKSSDELGGSVTCRLTYWVGKDGLLPIVFIALPAIRFMDRDKGVETPGMGSLIVAQGDTSKFLQIPRPFEEFAVHSKYTGPISIRASIWGDTFTLHEVSTDMWPEDILAGAELLKTTLFDFMYTLPESPNTSYWNAIGLSVVLSDWPWPKQAQHTYETYDSSIEVLEVARKHLALGDPALGILGIATSRGSDIREARRRVYRTVYNSVDNPRVQYREDIGMYQERDYEALKTWGWVE